MPHKPRINCSHGKPRSYIRRIRIRVYSPGNLEHHTRIILAPGGRHFTEDGIDSLLEAVAREIDERMAGHEYKLVELKESATFNFVCVRERTLDELTEHLQRIGKCPKVPDGDLSRPQLSDSAAIPASAS